MAISNRMSWSFDVERETSMFLLMPLSVLLCGAHDSAGAKRKFDHRIVTEAGWPVYEFSDKTWAKQQTVLANLSPGTVCTVGEQQEQGLCFPFLTAQTRSDSSIFLKRALP